MPGPGTRRGLAARLGDLSGNLERFDIQGLARHGLSFLACGSSVWVGFLGTRPIPASPPPVTAATKIFQMGRPPKVLNGMGRNLLRRFLEFARASPFGWAKLPPRS